MANAVNLLRPRPRIEQSKISTGRKLVPDLDGRRSQARRFRDLCAAMISELGRDPSSGELALIRQAATAIAASEALQARAIMGEATAAELGEVRALGNLVSRTLGMLGIRSRGGTAGLDLQAYLEGKAKP